MKSYSEIKQEEAGTLNRNKFIQYLYNECRWRQVDIAKKFRVSRQRIHQIINNPNVTTTYCQAHYDGFWGFYLKKLMDWVYKAFWLIGR